MTNTVEYRKARILVVDDQRVNVMLLEKLLISAGYECVTSTTDPLKAVAMFGEEEFDLILLDVTMPEMDGFEVMRRLRETAAGALVRVIILTALDDQETRLKALGKGAADYLTKPFDKAEVLLRIRNMLELRMLNNTLRNNNRLLEEKVMERTKELRATQYEVVQRLTRAAEFRDNDTGQHINRMSRYCEILGRAAGLDAENCELLLNASTMHDIGKIGIPDSILLKPGPLDADEWSIMKTHCEIGADLLADNDSPLMKMAHIIALTHHEKWDGTGYPAGKKGEDIPLVGRINALCDVFDALTSKRPYKKAWSEQDAINEITRMSGTHFDPDLAALFVENINRFLEIRNESQ